MICIKPGDLQGDIEEHCAGRRMSQISCRQLVKTKGHIAAGCEFVLPLDLTTLLALRRACAGPGSTMNTLDLKLNSPFPIVNTSW